MQSSKPDEMPELTHEEQLAQDRLEWEAYEERQIERRRARAENTRCRFIGPEPW